MQRTGKLIIFSAPSGAGKTTLVKHVLAHNERVGFSVSCTTRSKRPHEQDGKDYYFISQEDFKQKIKEDAFIEYEEVYDGVYYGTLKSEIQRIWDTNKHVVFDMDVEGGMNIKQRFLNHALTVFVKPPSLEVLKHRLEARNTESEDKLRMRLDKAEREILRMKDFDVVLVNNDLEEAKTQAQNIVEAFINS